MTKVKLGEVTINLDNRRKPLNNVQRQEKSVEKKYAYCGANNIVDYIDDYIFDETDEILCIAEDGGSWGKEEKCTYIMREKCWVNNHAHVIKMNKGVDINYISLFLNYTDLTPYITGSTRGKLTKSSLENIELDLPDYEAQVGISKKILSIQDLMEKKEKQLAKLNELVKSRFYEMFGDPVLNEMDWEVRTLKEICIKLTDGTHSSPKSFSTGKYRYVTAKNIKPSGFDFSNITFVSEEVHRSIYARCNPEQGDVLYIKDGATTGIAMVNTLDEEFTLLSSVALLKQNRNLINGCFLTSVLNHDMMFSNIRRNMGGAAITRLTISKLNNIQIPLPPLALQNQFADFVAEVDKSQLAIKKSLEELETLKKSLMQAYFG